MKAELRKRWSDELVKIDCYFINVEKRSNRFLKMKKDFEEYIERLIRIKKALDRKEKQRQLRSINRRFTLRKTLRLKACKLQIVNQCCLFSMTLSKYIETFFYRINNGCRSK